MSSAIRDNRKRGSIGDFLKEKISINAKLSFVSAYFTIYAYDKLKDKLDKIDHLNFLFGEPKWLQNLDPEKNKAKSFGIIDNAGYEQQKIKKERFNALSQKKKKQYAPIYQTADIKKFYIHWQEEFILKIFFPKRWYETTHMASGYLRYDIPYIEKIPLPDLTKLDLNKLTATVDQILSAKKQNPTANTSALENKIDLMVYSAGIPSE